MDVMQLRRGLMMGMANADALPDGWKKTTITNNGNRITTGDALATFLTNTSPSCKIAFGVLDRDMSVLPSQNNTITAFMWSGTTGGSAYQRVRGGLYQSLTYWISSYDTIVETGSTFTVVYIE